MTYCLGMVMREGLVMASDSRSNASLDDVNVCQKMHTIVDPGERVFILLNSGNLSCSQSILTLLRRDFDQGEGLASASSMYDAARVVGQQVRSVADMDQPDLNKHNFRFNVHLLVAGQIRGQPHDLYHINPQGNPLRATEDAPFLRVRSRQCQGFPRNPGRFHPGSGLSPSLDQLGAIEREASFL